MPETWEVLIDFPSYSISNLGNVVNTYRGRVMAQRSNHQGVRMVSLMDEHHRQVTRSVALLVAESFIPQPSSIFNSPIHLDGDRANCSVDNLTWRPRWFSVLYHRQFSDIRFYHRQIVLGIQGSRERFQGWADPCMRYGLLYKSIINSYHNNETVFPTGQRFVNLSW